MRTSRPEVADVSVAPIIWCSPLGWPASESDRKIAGYRVKQHGAARGRQQSARFGHVPSFDESSAANSWVPTIEVCSF